MGDILNDLTPQELLRLRDKAFGKRKAKACENCGHVVDMRRDQKFCCPQCRAAAARKAEMNLYERIIQLERSWKEEREGLLKEISELRHQLQQYEDKSIPL